MSYDENQLKMEGQGFACTLGAQVFFSLNERRKQHSWDEKESSCHPGSLQCSCPPPAASHAPPASGAGVEQEAAAKLP